MPEAEVDRRCNAGHYERTAARRDRCAGSYNRRLQTKAGEVTLKAPKRRRQTSETAIIEHYRRWESSVEERVGPSGRGHHQGAVGHARQSRHGGRTSTGRSTARSRLGGTTDRGRPLSLPRRHRAQAHRAGEVRNVSLLVAISVAGEGYRQILGIVESAKEDKAGWSAFLSHLKQRGRRVSS